MVSVSLSLCTGGTFQTTYVPAPVGNGLYFSPNSQRASETRTALSPVDKLSSRSLEQDEGEGCLRGLAASGELCPGVKQTLDLLAHLGSPNCMAPVHWSVMSHQIDCFRTQTTLPYRPRHMRPPCSVYFSSLALERVNQI